MTMACRSTLAAVCLICAYTFTITPPLYALFVHKAAASASASCETEWKLLQRAVKGCCDESKSQEHNPLPAPLPPPLPSQILGSKSLILMVVVLVV